MTNIATKFKSQSNASKESALPAVTVIASGKGGVGKTWCSITLATLAAKAGKKILLFDGDIGLANVDIQLGLNPKYDLYDYLSHTCEMEKAITTFSNDNASFDILAGRSGSGILSNLSPQQRQDIHKLFESSALKYDHIIIDLGAGIDQSIRNLGKFGATQVIITTTEPTALTDAYAYIKVMHQLNPGFNFQILVNRAPNEQAGMRTYNTLKKVCETYLELSPSLGGIIDEDSHISQSIRMQKNISTAFPNSKSVKQLKKIQETLFR